MDHNIRKFSISKTFIFFLFFIIILSNIGIGRTIYELHFTTKAIGAGLGWGKGEKFWIFRGTYLFNTLPSQYDGQDIDLDYVRDYDEKYYMAGGEVSLHFLWLGITKGMIVSAGFGLGIQEPIYVLSNGELKEDTGLGGMLATFSVGAGYQISDRLWVSINYNTHFGIFATLGFFVKE